MTTSAFFNEKSIFFIKSSKSVVICVCVLYYFLIKQFTYLHGCDILDLGDIYGIQI